MSSITENLAGSIGNVASTVEQMDMTPGYFQKLMEQAGDWLIHAGLRVVIAMLLVVIGLKIIGKVRGGLNRSMERAGVEITLRKFLDARLYAVLLGFLIFMAADELGIKSTSLVAIAGSITLAMSLAMQNSLSNFAGGVMVLFLKPFKVGDYISTPDGEGTVESIGLVYTTLVTLDNKKITIPNSNMTASVITNVTGLDKRRLVLDVGISYTADLKKAKDVLKQLLEEYPLVLKDEDMTVVVDNLGESSVNLNIRAWVKTEDYWKTKWDLTEAIKLAFDREGIEIPYNYLNVQVTHTP